MKDIEKMVHNKFSILLFLTLIVTNLFAQEQLKHSKKTYIAHDQKYYYNNDLPAYLFISTSPDSTAAAFRITSESSKKYTNPFYFANEGLNKITTPSCVDTVSKITVRPLRDIVFEVYADKQPPKSKAKFSKAKRSERNGKIFYGKDLNVDLISTDNLSGVEKIYFSVNDLPFREYSSQLTFEGIKTHEYTLKYYAVDNVGNIEKIITEKFNVDITAPQTRYVLGEVQDGEAVLSEDSYIRLKSEDDLSGVKEIYFSVDGSPFKLYQKEIYLGNLKGGAHKLDYYAVDNVGNSGSKSSTQELDGEVIEYLSFDIDKEGPITSIQFIGDQYKGKTLYISERTKIMVKSADKESGTAYIYYGINSPAKTNIYEKPFSIVGKEGQRIISYTALDNLKNLAPNKQQIVYFDNIAPKTTIQFQQPVFKDRDTLFIHKNSLISLIPTDAGSGVQKTIISIDEGEFIEYKDKLAFETPGFHKIKFKSIDNVNNEEVIKENEFVIDNTSPEISVTFSIKPIAFDTFEGSRYPVYPPYFKLYMGASDQYTGTKSIMISVDNGKPMEYQSAQDLINKGVFIKEKFYKIKIVAKDMLGNESERMENFFVRRK